MAKPERREPRARVSNRRTVRLLVLGLLVSSLLPVAPALSDDHRDEAPAPRDLHPREPMDLREAHEVFVEPDDSGHLHQAADGSTDRLVILRAQGIGVARADEHVADLGLDGAKMGRLAGGNFQVIELGEEVPLDRAEEIAAQLVDDGVAVHAEPDHRVTIASPVNDPGYPMQWHLQGPSTESFGIDAPAAWSLTTGSADVVVAVLDTGILDHPDIVDRLLPGYDFVDGKSNAYDPGDWKTEGQCPNSPGAADSSWHGLHVAGTVGAMTNNNLGVAGVDQQARILPVRVLGTCGGYGADVADGIRWAAGLQVGSSPVNPHPADVINLSLGGSGNCTANYQSAIDAATNAGALVVAAAGNSGGDAAGFRPANCDRVVAVAATNRSGERASYSNYGAIVDVAAPGGSETGGVLSIWNTGKTTPGSDALAWMAGTSMAAPHVAGVASLVLATDPSLVPAEVSHILEETAKPFASTSSTGPSFVCSDAFQCGAGIVDAGAAVAVASLAPPTLWAEPGQDQVALTWTPVSPAAGLGRYELYQSTTATCSTSGELIYASSGTSHTDTGLTAGTTYRYCIRTIDDNGDPSRLSSAVEAVPTADPAPNTPTGLAATPGIELVNVSWDAMAGAATYRLYQTTGPTCQATGSPVHDGPETAVTRTGLSAGTTYRFCVQALSGEGAVSTVSPPVTAIPAAPPVPAIPTELKATAGQEKVTVAWKGVSGADSYELYRRTSPCTESSKGSQLFKGAATSFTDTSVNAGMTYHYCVRALNTTYNTVSPLSGSVNATPTAPPPPPAPTPSAPSWSSGSGLGFDLITGGVRLSWPKANGTVTRYRVQRNGSTLGTTTGLSRNVTGLSNGQRYQLRVRAENSGGASPWLTMNITPTTGFRDVPSSSGFRNDIRWLATAEVTRGCNPPTNDRFCPSEVVTREQMAAFMVRALGLTKTSSRGTFSDVPTSNTFRDDINKLATAGITAGCNPPANTRFCPKDPVSREQMAAFMTRALKLSKTSGAGDFRDVPASNHFRSDINRLATARITAGCNPPTNDRFCPKDPVTRQQMAAFMRRALSG